MAAMGEQINLAIAKADKEVGEAEAADKKYQGLMKSVREAGELFNSDLKAFRRTLGNAVGRNDKD